jgi:2-keto-4-pentenoate hydratase/2-oxohepta-3-ene-1,7-dioic acid hydratase in catechol pathway
MAGAQMGTVNYMAPEQRVDAGRVDARADLYAVGVVLYVTTVCSPGDEVPLDPRVTSQLDYEVELAFVMKRAGKDISRRDALDYVAAYTIFNDGSRERRTCACVMS